MKKKTLIIFIILITIINAFMPMVNALAINSAKLTNDHSITSHVQYYNYSYKEWRDVQCNYICYYLTKSEEYPAYCVQSGIHGVDEEGDYTVDINKLYDNKTVYNIMLNGYPYKTPAQLGLSSVDDAYFATKHAIKSYLINRNVTTYYKAKDATGTKIINAICEIMENGKKGSSSNKDAVVSISKVGDLKESGNYYYQEYTVNADANISNYSITNVEGFSDNSYISDTSRKQKRKIQ